MFASLRAGSRGVGGYSYGSWFQIPTSKVQIATSTGLLPTSRGPDSSLQMPRFPPPGVHIPTSRAQLPTSTGPDSKLQRSRFQPPGVQIPTSRGLDSSLKGPNSNFQGPKFNVQAVSAGIVRETTAASKTSPQASLKGCAGSRGPSEPTHLVPGARPRTPQHYWDSGC